MNNFSFNFLITFTSIVLISSSFCRLTVPSSDDAHHHHNHNAINSKDAKEDENKYFSSPFTSCASGSSSTTSIPKSVRIFGCTNSNDSICTMSRNTKEKSRFEVDFVAPFDSRSLWTDVRARLVSSEATTTTTTARPSSSWFFSRPSTGSSSSSGSSLVSNIYVPVPSSVIERDACGDKHGVNCPLLTGRSYTYKHDFDPFDTAASGTTSSSWTSPIINSINNLVLRNNNKEGARMEIMWKFTDYWGFPLNCFKLQVLVV